MGLRELKNLFYRILRYKIFWEEVGLEQDPPSLVSIIEGLLGGNSTSCGLQYGRGDPLRWPWDTICPQNLVLTSPTSGGRFVGVFRSLTKATKCLYSFFISWSYITSSGLILGESAASCFYRIGAFFRNIEDCAVNSVKTEKETTKRNNIEVHIHPDCWKHV
jgi:hypothetical protein